MKDKIKRRCYSDEEIQNICKDYISGLSVGELCDKYQRNQNSISYILRNISHRQTRNRLRVKAAIEYENRTAIDFKGTLNVIQICENYLCGLSVKQIGLMYGINDNSIRKILCKVTYKDFEHEIRDRAYVFYLQQSQRIGRPRKERLENPLLSNRG